MKIKFTLQRSAGPVDLVATVDSGTTVGALARHLSAADSEPAHPLPGTLTLTTGTGSKTMSIDPEIPVVDSGLRSGQAVGIGVAGEGFHDPHRAAAALVKVISGPDVGREFEIGSGSSVIGRGRTCEIRVTDSLASRRHARINVGEFVEIIDLGSANGVLIDDIAVPRSVLRSADEVQVGDNVLSVRRLQTAVATQRVDATVDFIRSPRLDPLYEGRTFEAPELPERARPQRFPIIALLAPLIMGGVLYLVTKNILSILFVALSPLMLIGSALESRLGGRSDYKRALKEFHADVDDLIAEIRTEQAREVERRNGEHPATSTAASDARSGGPLMWTRRPGVRSFGVLRLGSGRLPSRNTIELPSAKRATRALLKELTDRTDPLAAVDDVPVVADLAASAVGVAGPRLHALPVVRALVCQVAALHSPAEVHVAAVVSSSTAADWDWLKWLPHTTGRGPLADARLLASNAVVGGALVSELETLLAERQGAESDAEDAVLPAVVLLVEADSAVQHSRLAGLAEHGASHGIHVVWLADEVAGLPAACKTFVEITREGSTGLAGFVHLGTQVQPVALEQLGAEPAASLARHLSPIVDLDAQTEDASDLPRSVSLLSLPGAELGAAPTAVLERWTQNRSLVRGPMAPSTPVKHIGSLRAVIGQAAGEAHAIDLRSDGPHALVGGTTGAGKSELLQAWILGMAAAHSPQRLTFLLVDYKGGAAFKECADLPHTVGLVTDLSQHLVRRALTSLSAELTYRERFLHQHSAKDLAELEKKGVRDAPPSLVLVVDEFAALVSEVPEFVDGVVNVAQRGRSLGFHLILATQRPAGVIKDNLRANTNLRIALRMADEGDSSDVLGSPEAAFFDPALPGRAVSKTGPGRLVPFQTGYAGGWTSEEPAPPDIRVEELTLGNGAVWELPEAEETVAPDPGPTDIARLVDSIGEAAAAAGVEAPRKPWLPELRECYDLADQNAVRSRRVDTELVFGIQDMPQDQAQPTVAFHPDTNGNLAVFGTGGSGKSTLLRTLAVAAGFTIRGGPCHVYGIDFGARGLSMLEPLPHVGSIIGGADHERITRLLGWLRSAIDERAVRYSRANAGTITDYRRLTSATDEPRILLLVDGVAAFRQAYEAADRLRWFDLFTSIAADGRPVGVHVILSSDQRGGMPTALQSAMQSRLVLRMSSPDDYSMLGVVGDVLTPTSAPGRGVLFDREVQVAVLGGDRDVTAQAAAIRSFAESMRRNGVAEAPEIRALPETIPLGDLPSSVDTLPVVGVASGSLGPATVVPEGPFVVCGPPGSGRTTALHSLAASLLRWRPDTQLHYFGHRRSALADLPFWHSRALTPDEAGTAASDLAARLGSWRPGNAPVAVFVEGLAEFANGLAEMSLQQLVKQCALDGHFVVGEGETSTFATSMGLLGQFKTARAGIALAPDPGDGATVFKTTFPRLPSGQLPPGRGVIVRRGLAEIVQVAVPTTG